MPVIAGIVLVAVAIFVGPLVGCFVGAFCGWIVGLVFDESMAQLAKALGTTAYPYQIGAMLGFVGGFFRSSVSSTS